MEQGKKSIILKTILTIIVLVAFIVLGALAFYYFSAKDNIQNIADTNEQFEMNQTQLQEQNNIVKDENPINSVQTINEIGNNTINTLPNGNQTSNSESTNLETKKLLSNSYYYTQLNETRKGNL